MSRIAHLFAVPLTLVSTDDLNFNEKSKSDKTNGGAEAKDKVSGTTLEDKKNGETKLNGEVHNTTTKRKRKNKKQQSRPAPVRTYIDYDKNLEDNQPSLWMWQCSARSTDGSQQVAPGTSMFSPAAQREVVSYQELSQSQNLPRSSHSQDRNGCQPKNESPGIKNRGQLLVQKNPHFLSGQQNKQNSSLSNKGPFLKRKANQHQHPNKFARMNTAANNTNRNSINGNNNNGSTPSLQFALANNFIDPLVTATEKKELFQRPKPQPVDVNSMRKPLTSKQRKNIEKAKFYKEKLRLQLEKDKERIASMKQLPCRFFSNGKCTKGAECPFNHEFVPQKKPELCKFYLISFCEKGASCLYYHNDWPCKFFHAYRSCAQGDRCRFSHQPLTEETRQLLEKSLNESSQPGVPVAGTVTQPEPQRTIDAKPPDPFSFFGASNAHQPCNVKLEPMDVKPWNVKLEPMDVQPWNVKPEPMDVQPWNVKPEPMDVQPWNVKLEPIDVDDSYRSYIPANPSGSDPRIKERLLRKDQPVSYLAPHERDPPVLLEYPRIAYFSLDVQDSSSNPTGDKISLDYVTVNGNSGCFKPNPAVAEEATKDLVLPSATSSLNLLSATDGAPDEVKTARHLSLPIMQIVARGSADKFTRLKRGNGVLVPDSPNLQSASS